MELKIENAVVWSEGKPQTHWRWVYIFTKMRNSCKKEIADQVIDKKADSVLALNRKNELL